MAKNFLASTKVTRFDLEDGYWVDIKDEMSYEDQQKLAASYVAIQTKMIDQKENQDGNDIRLDLGNITLMKLNITDWNLTDETGNKLLLTGEVFGSLKIPVARAIVKEIQGRNPVPKV